MSLSEHYRKIHIRPPKALFEQFEKTPRPEGFNVADLLLLGFECFEHDELRAPTAQLLNSMKAQVNDLNRLGLGRRAVDLEIPLLTYNQIRLAARRFKLPFEQLCIRCMAYGLFHLCEDLPEEELSSPSVDSSLSAGDTDLAAA